MPVLSLKNIDNQYISLRSYQNIQTDSTFKCNKILELDRMRRQRITFHFRLLVLL